VSIRDELAAALADALDPDIYPVEGALRTPTRIDPGKHPVRVWQTTLTRNLTFGTVTVDLVVWVLTGKIADDNATEDDLDDALDDVLGVIHTSNPKWTWTTAERAMFDTPDGQPAWHGYRIAVVSVGKLSKGTP
jgi:hypothetical protein